METCCTPSPPPKATPKPRAEPGSAPRGHLHLNFSSSVPLEVTDSAWMNSENSILPSWGRNRGV